MSTPLMSSLGLDRLTVDEKIVLLDELEESIARESGPFTLSEAQKQELQRRLDAHRDNPKAGTPWEEVKARILKGRR